MADSEISTSLSRLSRRDVLSAVLLTAGGASFDRSAAAAARADGTTDAAVVVWKAWRAAHRRTLALCREQQRLEAALAQMIGFPQVVIDAAELPSFVRIGSLRQFDELAAELPSICSQRDEVAAALRAHQLRWDDADRAAGYTVTRQMEASSFDDEAQLAERLLAAEATSMSGISAKLDALLAIGADGSEGRHFPWPELRRIRRDVARLAQAQRTVNIDLTA